MRGWKGLVGGVVLLLSLVCWTPGCGETASGIDGDAPDGDLLEGDNEVPDGDVIDGDFAGCEQVFDGDDIVDGDTADCDHAMDGDTDPVPDGDRPYTQRWNMYFTEYVAGGGFSAIEILNTDFYGIDLRICSVEVYQDGSTTPAVIPLPAMSLMPGEIHVLCGSQPADGGEGLCDQVSPLLNHDGNDALILVCNGLVNDVFGRVGENPGAAWGSGSSSTRDRTLRRKCTVWTGDQDGSDPFDPAQEWDGFSTGILDGLGTVDCGQPALVWVAIPAGSFEMGCSPCDAWCSQSGWEHPRHPVSVEQFEMTATEVTQQQYFAVMRTWPSQLPYCGGDCPVDHTTWESAEQFCEEVGGRLPSEAEWEYAARAGTTTRYVCGNEPGCLGDTAWYYDNSAVDYRGCFDVDFSTCSRCSGTHPVGQKIPNPFGLYDMLGNATEWVRDCWHDNYAGAPGTAGIWPGGDCSKHALRGGGISDIPRFVRVSNRYLSGGAGPGFRCARGSGNTASDGDEDADDDAELEAREYPEMACSDGVCLDPSTGFEWQQEPTPFIPEETMNWDEALAYCRNLELKGAGWRLPNISELRSLVRNCRQIETGGSCGVVDACEPCGTAGPACLTEACLSDCVATTCSEINPSYCNWDPALGFACIFYWSSSTQADRDTYAWIHEFEQPSIHAFHKSAKISVRCVRQALVGRR